MISARPANGSLSPGGTWNFCVQAQDSSGNPISGATVYLSFDDSQIASTDIPSGDTTGAGGTTGGSATATDSEVTNSPLTSSFTSFFTDSTCSLPGGGTDNHAITVTYTAPDLSPGNNNGAPYPVWGGRDFITAQDSASVPSAVSNTVQYQFSPVTSYVYSDGSQIAPTGSLAAGQPVPFTFTAEDVHGNPVQCASVLLSLTSTASPAGSATADGTSLGPGALRFITTGTAPCPTTSGTAGEISLTYTAPSIASGSIDTLTANNHPTIVTVSASTTYSVGSGYTAPWVPPASLGATVAGTLHPISWGPGNEDVFWRGTDGNLWQMYTINGTWYGPQQMTTLGNLASDPQPISWGYGNEEVFWRGTDGNLWQMYYLNGWQGPASLGDGPLGNATPVPVSWGFGNIEVFWEGTDQNIWEAYYDNGWIGPVGLGDGPLGTGTTLSGVSWGVGNIDLFWKGTDQNLWEAYYAYGWHGPVGLGDGPLGSAPHPVASAPGVLDVFWEGSDQGLWHAWYNGGWNGPGTLPGKPLGSQPIVTSWGGGRVDVFWVGTDGNLWHDWYQNGWSGPQNLGGGPLESQPAPVTFGQPGYIDVVWTGPNSTLWNIVYGSA